MYICRKGARMVQKEKVAAMTHLAIEEKHQQHLSFITRHYWFNDYITTEMWKAFFAITITYALVFLLGLVAYGDIWTVTYHIEDAVRLGEILLAGYGIAVVFGVLLCALSHVWLYKQAYRKQERIRTDLRRLNRIYALDEALENVRRMEEKSD